MKKFLSLVLALVMAMSLVTIGAGAADFSDKGSIDYEEAIAVMNAVEVVSGYADGTFRPDAVLTRGAASKIICNMLLGPTSAAALSVNSAPFSDVAADSTFAGYIAYMAKEGIVSGYADGTFRPGANLTGYAFMKMLLTALGYDAKTEGYVGANWSVAVAKRALAEGLADDLDGAFNGLKPVTRQEACLYAFNTLKAPMVDYGDKTSIVAPGVNITTTSKASKLKYSDSNVLKANWGKINKTWADDEVSGDDIALLGEQVFPKLSRNTNTPDDFGRPGQEWFVGGTSVGTYNKKATVTFTESTKAANIVKALSGYRVTVESSTTNTSADKLYKIADDVKMHAKDLLKVNYVFNNGQDVNGYGPGGTANYYSLGADTIASALSTLTTNNRQVEIFTNSDNIVTDIIVVEYSVAEVESVVTNSKGNTKYTLKPKDTVDQTITSTCMDFKDDSADTDTIKFITAPQEEDIVTYVQPQGKSKVYVYPTTKVSGEATVVASDKTVTLGGTDYKSWPKKQVGGAKRTTIDALGADSGNIDLYLDQYGHVAYTSSASTTDVYMLNSIWETKEMGKATGHALLISLTGKTEEVTMNNYTDYSTMLDAVNTTNANKPVVFVTKSSVGGKTGLTTCKAKSGGNAVEMANNDFEKQYIVNGDTKVYDITNDVKTVNEMVFTKSKQLSKDDTRAKLGTNYYYFSDDIELVFVKDKGPDLKITKISGTANVKLGETNVTGIHLVIDKNNEITQIIITGKNAPANGADLFFMGKKSSGTQVDEEGDQAKTQKFYIAGEEDSTSRMLEDDLMTLSGFYTYSIDEKTGRYDMTWMDENVAAVYVQTADVANVLFSQKYLRMKEIVAESATGVGAEANINLSTAEKFVDLSDFGTINDGRTLENALKNNNGAVGLVVFVKYSAEKTTNAEIVYIMNQKDVAGWDLGPSGLQMAP